MFKAAPVSTVSLDKIILWFGSRESMESEFERRFCVFRFTKESIGNRWERTYSAKTYEQARDEFKRELAINGYDGVFYYGWSMPENRTYCFKGYPVREKNKNSRQSR
jgi:hypothetical protein